jgi:predicted flap endonuclease-1-like 5' DNA nuclease
MLLNALVRASWFARAPQRLAAALAAAEGAADRPGELPAGIGKPATRALFGAGVSTVEQVAAHTEDELLALHGVGPKAVRILAAALAERGMSLRSP